MEGRYARIPSPRALLALYSILFALVLPAQCLYFYFDGTTPKCFYEELPRDTLVVGEFKADNIVLEHDLHLVKMTERTSS